MKKNCITFLLIGFGLMGAAQVHQADTALTSKYLLTLAVPDMPASKALGTDPSNILRPSDIQKFAAAFSPFYSNGSAVIPKNFALEVAPWKLLSKSWTLQKYNSGINSILYNSSFSVGTNTDTSRFPSKLSLGYRVSFVSRKNDILKAALDRRSTIIKEMTAELMVAPDLHFLKIHWMTDIKGILPGHVNDSSGSPGLQKEFAAFLDMISEPGMGRFAQKYPAEDISQWQGWYAPVSAYHGQTQANILDSLSKTMDSLITVFNQGAWNANRFDLAVAWVGQSADSLIKNSEYANFYFWSTYAIGIGKNCQLLLGTNLLFPRTAATDSVKHKFGGTFNTRFYFGTAGARGFIEGQFKNQNYDHLKNSLLVNLGAEFKIGGSFWVVAGAGINNYFGTKNPFNQFVSSLNLRYSFNKPN